MKKFISTLFLTGVLFAGSARGAEEVVFVDLQEVFKRFYKTQLAQDQIRQQADDIKLERETMEGEIKTMKEEVEVLRTDSRDETLGAAVRESKRGLLEEKLVALQKREQEMTDFEKLRMQQLEQQNTRMSRKLFDEIQEVIVEYSKEKGFAGVIDRSAQSRAGMQLVLFASPKVDITGDVLAVLNEGREETLIKDTAINVENAE